MPGRTLPLAGAALVLVLALPVFLVADWRLAGWALGAVLWMGTTALDLLLTRVRDNTGSLAASGGVVAFGLFFKAIGLLVVLLVTAVTNPRLAAAAAIVYVLAYTFELGLSLFAYFGSPAR